MGAERGVAMSNKEKHICTDCIHDDVCEWAVSNENMFICGSFIDKKVLERPQGEWIDEKFVAFHLTCNQCGCHLRKQKNEVFEGDFDYNFCPNCGADMRKEAEND